MQQSLPSQLTGSTWTGCRRLCRPLVCSLQPQLLASACINTQVNHDARRSPTHQVRLAAPMFDRARGSDSALPEAPARVRVVQRDAEQTVQLDTASVFTSSKVLQEPASLHTAIFSCHRGTHLLTASLSPWKHSGPAMSCCTWSTPFRPSFGSPLLLQTNTRKPQVSGR